MWVVERVHDNFTGRSGSAIIHEIRKVVEEEHPSHDIAAHPELRKGRAWVDHGREQPGLEAIHEVVQSLSCHAGLD